MKRNVFAVILLSALFIILSITQCSSDGEDTAHQELWNKLEYEDFAPVTRPLTLTHVRELQLSPLFTPAPEAPAGLCSYNTAAELVASCPTQEEIQQIRADFNIYFENGLIDNGVLVPWSCTADGDESSIMLSMYNAFRLLKCVPFDENFPWAPDYNNLYDWLKSLDLTAIGYIWAEEGEYNHGWNGRIYIIGNHLDHPMYRDIVNPQSGVGIIHPMVLLIHEARHAGDGVPHNCGYKDTDLEYMGAWAVQYYLLGMLAENTGNYFSDYERSSLLGSAQNIYETRFCDLE
jgi:hypothetical protein